MAVFTHASVPSLFCRVTCGLWESPLIEMAEGAPRSTFLWVKSAAGLLCRCGRVLPAALLLLHRALRDSSWRSKAESSKSTRNPFISEWCEGICIYEARLEGEGKQTLSSLVCLIYSVYSLSFNYSSPVVKLELNHKECKRQHIRNSKLIFRAWVMGTLALGCSHSY